MDDEHPGTLRAFRKEKRELDAWRGKTKGVYDEADSAFKELTQFLGQIDAPPTIRQRLGLD